MTDYVMCAECGTEHEESAVGDTTVIDRTEEEGIGWVEVQFTCPSCNKFAQSIRITK